MCPEEGLNRSISRAHTHTVLILPRLSSLFSLALSRPPRLFFSVSARVSVPGPHLFFMEVNCVAPLCSELCLCNPQR